jgi:hypothetical protein
MEQKDPLMRMIEMIGRILGRVLVKVAQLNSIARLSESMGEIRKTFKDELDLDLEALIGTAEEEIVSYLKSKKLGVQNFELFADVLLEIGEGYHSEGAVASANAYQARALKIYEYLDKEGKTFSAVRQNKITRIRERQ